MRSALIDVTAPIVLVPVGSGVVESSITLPSAASSNGTWFFALSWPWITAIA